MANVQSKNVRLVTLFLHYGYVPGQFLQINRDVSSVLPGISWLAVDG